MLSKTFYIIGILKIYFILYIILLMWSQLFLSVHCKGAGNADVGGGSKSKANLVTTNFSYCATE